jgi:hypothetical protein
MADAREIQGRASPQPAQLFARKRAPTSAVPSACRSPLAGDARTTGQGSTAGKPSACLRSSGFSSPAASGSSCMADPGRFRVMPRHNLPSCSPASGLLRRPSRRLVGARLRATRGLQGKDRPRENRPHAYAAPDSARPLRPGRRAWLMRGRFRGVPRHSLPSCSPASGLLRRPPRRLVGARLRATRGLQGKDRPRENRPHA